MLTYLPLKGILLVAKREIYHIIPCYCDLNWSPFPLVIFSLLRYDLHLYRYELSDAVEVRCEM